MQKKKVAIIGTNGIPARYGGFETLSNYLTEELGGKYDFTVYCSSVYKKEERLDFYNSARLIYFPLKANGIQSILYDLISTFHAWFASDILIVLGPASGFILPLNYLFRKKLIVNHGGLNEWEREKLSFIQKKYAYWNHRLAAKSAQVNIVDNIPLRISLEKTFGVKTEIVEYGGDHIHKLDIDSKYLLAYPFLKKGYDLSISRAQIDNNLHLLLETYSRLPERNLVLISNWDVSDYGRILKEKYDKKFSNIYIVDAVYEQEILNVIRSNTTLYVHSHSQCGTAPSLVEAMSYEIPVICYDVPTNRATTKNVTLYFNNSKSLEKILKKLDAVSLSQIETAIFKIAKDNYTWERIATKYAQIIDSL